MCHFFVIGAVTDGWRLAGSLEEELQSDAALPAQDVRAAFPPEDTVRVITTGGCSCGLFQSSVDGLPGHRLTSGTVWLTPQARRGLAAVLERVGTARLYVQNRRQALQGSPRHATMTVAELLSGNTGLPSNVLIDLVPGVSAGLLN